MKDADIEALVEIPVYEKYRGKSFHGEKSAKTSFSEKSKMKRI